MHSLTKDYGNRRDSFIACDGQLESIRCILSGGAIILKGLRIGSCLCVCVHGCVALF